MAIGKERFGISCDASIFVVLTVSVDFLAFSTLSSAAASSAPWRSGEPWPPAALRSASSAITASVSWAVLFEAFLAFAIVLFFGLAAFLLG